MASISIAYYVLYMIVVVVLLLFSRRRYRIIKLIEKIPGPKAYPIIGNYFEINPTDIPREERHHFLLKFVNTYGQIFKTWAGPFPIVNISNADMIEPWLGSGLLTANGRKWHEHRKMLTPAFHYSTLESFLDVIVERNNIFLKRLEAKENSKTFDIVPYLSELTLDIICETAMGVRLNIQEGFSAYYIKSVHGLIELISNRVMVALWYINFFYRFSRSYTDEMKYVKQLHNMSSSVIRERIKQRKEMLEKCEQVQNLPGGMKIKKAFLDILLDIREQEYENLSMTDIREEVDTFMFEGHDTTSAALLWTVYLIGLYPDVQEKIIAEVDKIFSTSNRSPTREDLIEMKYLESVFKESMRLYPPVPILVRHTVEDVTLGGYEIPAGTEIFVFIYCLHRSPEYYPNPEKFDPSNFSDENIRKRHPFAYIPFSAGPRNCIGQKFALMEEKVILSSLFRKYRVKSHQKREEVGVIIDSILRPRNGIWVSIEKRNKDNEIDEYFTS